MKTACLAMAIALATTPFGSAQSLAAEPRYATGNPADWPAELDAVVAAPDNHEVLLENDTVRVLSVTLAPGEVEPLHSHRWPSVLHIQSAGHFTDHDAKGQLIFDSRQAPAPMKLPLTMWKGPEAPHSPTNLSEDVTIRLLRVEVKHPAPPRLQNAGSFPQDGSLVRPEDGVILADGRLLVADQAHGLVSLDTQGKKQPFGRFAEAGYRHAPPAHAAGPNGVALEPDGVHVLVADIFTGAIWRVDTRNQDVTRAYQHEFGVNAARRDSTGALWFTQSTRNQPPDSEARMFAAVNEAPRDGALFRIAPATSGSAPVAELKASDLNFANGLAIDEAADQIYVAETMGNRIIHFPLSAATGELGERRVLASLRTPDNIELDGRGRLWVASPVGNALYVVDTQSGEWTTAFHPQAEAYARMMVEWERRTDLGEPRLPLFGPDMWSSMPGLVTGMILSPDGQPAYVTGLGNALVKLEAAGTPTP
ncbi:SMP-30/gluconolactonase/LRE family protein [Arenimonas donghaensis]|nr:SMP-30/gluconolactonase/LRE family protein [Arenimonas donghaensis]